MQVNTNINTKTKSKIPKHRPTHCFKCDAPIYLKPLYVEWDWKVKLIPFGFYDGQRHYCPCINLESEQQLLQQEITNTLPKRKQVEVSIEGDRKE
jgi:hypothetical protein